MFLLEGPESERLEPMRVWTYRPRRLTPDSRILFVLHGVKRDAERYRDAWIRHAEAYNVLLVAPEFSREQFPGGRRYNQGNMIAVDGRSEENTSELQSLMRISYAVFCLKKIKRQRTQQHLTQH